MDTLLLDNAPARIQGSIVKLESVKCSFFASFYCFLKRFYFCVCVVFNVAELCHYSALCPTDKLEFCRKLFLHRRLRYLQFEDI